jgi:23S rRNA (guanosine2251-2'-O)-methyltransferase
VAGNSQRRGAVRKPSKSPKGATVGSGGQRRKGLAGKGPTPKAAEREYHPAAKKGRAASQRGTASTKPGYASGPRPQGRPARGSGRSGGGRASSEVVAGRNAVVEALRADVPVTTMYVAGRIDADDRVREALKTAAERGIPILETPRGELDRLTDGAVHQGLAVQVPPYAYVDATDLIDPQAPGIPLVVALDGVTDPRNLGAVIRSVAAFGGHGVVLPERRSAGMTASAWKTSAGAAARVPVARVPNLTRSLEAFQKAGFFVLGLDMDGDVDLPGLALATEPVVVVVGSEGKGLSRLVRETCDQVVSIPMSSGVESLNAGVAAGVTLYEIARQRAAAR